MLDQIRNCRKSNNHNKEWLCAPSGEVMSGEHGEEHEGVAALSAASSGHRGYWDWGGRCGNTEKCDVIRLYTAAAAALCHHAADLVQTLSQDYQSYCKVVSNVSHAIISHQKWEAVCHKSKQCHKTQDWWGPCAREQLYPVTKTVSIRGNVE